MKEKTDLFNSKKILKKQGYKGSIKNVWGIKNFTPVRCGEDDESRIYVANEKRSKVNGKFVEQVFDH